MTDVWLAEKSGYRITSHVFGIFSTHAKAVKVCQDSADEYFGAAKTTPLNWDTDSDDSGYCSSSYIHPAGGLYLFQVTRFTVDEVDVLE